MWFPPLRAMKTSNTTPRRRTPLRLATARFRPRLEALEGRLVLSQVALTVSSLADAGPGTLRAAILAADAGKSSDKFTVGFSVTGTIDLLSPLPDLSNTIAIQGPGAGSFTIQRDSAIPFSSAIITIAPGQTAGLSGATIADGDAGGIANQGGTLAVSGCIISGNSGQNGGGISSTGMVTISDSAVIGNTASFDGGGIWSSGTLTVSTSTLSGNRARSDAGGAISTGGTLTLTDCTVAGNFAAIGGGIFNNTGGSATIQQDCTLSGNTAASGGGISNGGTLTVRGCTVTGNAATGFDFGGHHFAGRGGGIDNFGVATIQDSSLSGNTANVGGGIFNEAIATLDVRGSAFSGNTASDSGGAVANLGTATIQESTLFGNTAGAAGGGVFNGPSGTLAVKDSAVTGNSAPAGADLFALGAVTIDDSTVDVIGP